MQKRSCPSLSSCFATSTLRSVALACGIVLLATSCQKDLDPITDAPGQGQEQSIHAKLMAYFGLPADAIVREADGWVVDGDVLVSYEAAERIGTGSKQARKRSGLITDANQGNITVTVQSHVESGWATAMTQAIAEWNAAPNCAIQISEVDQGGEIQVYMYDSPEPNVIAQGQYPNGNAGTYIRINRAFNHYSIAKKKHTLAHEIGHTLGFMHTDNWRASTTTGDSVPGTPDSDPSSVMNCCQGGSDWNGFSFFDKYLFALTYPENPPPANTVAVYHYNHLGSGDHFYTEDWSELGGIVAPGNYQYWDITCYTKGSMSLFPQTAPLYRYYFVSNGKGYHYYTCVGPSGLPSSMQYEGDVGHVFLAQQPGTVPLYRSQFFSWMPYHTVLNLQGFDYGPDPVILGYVYPPPIPLY